MIKTMEKFKDCYYIGDHPNCNDHALFKARLVGNTEADSLNCSVPIKRTWLNLLAVWSIVFGLILLLTIYEYHQPEEGDMVRITLGRSSNRFRLIMLWLISVSWSSAFLSLPVHIRPIINSTVLFKIKALALAFLVFINC